VTAPEVYAPTPLPTVAYRDAARQGAAVYRIDPKHSLLLIHVGRAGAMKNIGHDHVIASEDLDGFVLIADDAAASRADLQLPLPRLIVDKAEYRTRFGLEPDVPVSAIEGTTRNMQDKVLESDRYPVVDVSARFSSVHDDPPTIGVSITLHGATFEYIVPVQLDIVPGRITAKGTMSVSHADFGLQPFSAAAGLLRIADVIDLDFELLANRWVPTQD
jgi:polyisoprenoid-binding protein YceI